MNVSFCSCFFFHYTKTRNTKRKENYNGSIICIFLKVCSKAKKINNKKQKFQQVQLQLAGFSIKWYQISSFDIAHNVTKLSQVKKITFLFQAFLSLCQTERKKV